jgi:hypothetical protein
MLVVDLVLGAAVVALIATNLRDKKLLKENRKLLTENRHISEYMLGDPIEGNFSNPTPHDWSDPQPDTVLTSKSPLSYDRVVVNVTHCNRCKLVHRYIVSGYSLAKKKGLLDVEGFYRSGVKVPNQGCEFKHEHEIIDITLDDE